MPELENRQSQRATKPAVIILATVLASLPILAVSQFIAHARVDEFDAWLFAYYGREMLDGRTLYADLWDNKPPGIFWVNALGLGLSGRSLAGVWVLCALATCGAAALVFAATKRLYGWSAAGIATVLAALYLNVWLYHVGCNRPSTFFVPTELACFALYCLVLTGAKRPRTVLFAAGVCGGLGVCFKQTAIAMSAAVALHTLYLGVRRQLGSKEVVSRLVLFGAGGCVTVALATVAVLLTADPKLAWNAVVGFNRLYFAPEAGSSVVPRFFAVEQHIRVLGLPVILALATIVQPLLRRWVGRARAKDDDPIGMRPLGLLFLLWVWMLCGIYLALVGPHRRMHYFGIALPPLVMLSAHGVYLLLRSGRRIRQTQPTYHVVVGVLWFGYMVIFPLHQQVVEAGKQHFHRFAEVPNRAYAETLAAVRRLTGPEDTIFVFGYGPKLYWDADRPSAIRYIGTEKAGQLREQGQPLFEEITALLMEADPKAIIVHPKHFQGSPFVKGLDTARVEAWVRANYNLLQDEPSKDLWIRRESLGNQSSGN